MPLRSEALADLVPWWRHRSVVPSVSRWHTILVCVNGDFAHDVFISKTV